MAADEGGAVLVMIRRDRFRPFRAGFHPANLSGRLSSSPTSRQKRRLTMSVRAPSGGSVGQQWLDALVVGNSAVLDVADPMAAWPVRRVHAATAIMIAPAQLSSDNMVPGSIASPAIP